MSWVDEWRGVRYAPPHSGTSLFLQPAIEPLTLAEAKRHCRISTDDENGDVLRWIKAARRQVELETGRALLTQTWDLFLDGFLSSETIALPYPPLQSVTSVNATPMSGAESVWLATNYVVDTASVPGRIGLATSGSWPSDVRTFQPIRIRFVAGWTSPDAIPPDLREAVALLVGWFSENRQPGEFESVYYDRLIAPHTVFSAA